MPTYKGWEGTVYIDGVAVARARGLTLDISTNIEPIYVIGSRDPVVLKEGNREYTGTIDKLFVDNTLFSKLNLDSSTQTEYTISGIITDGTNTKSLTIKGVKFSSWSFELPQDDFVTESVDFTATGVILE